MKKIILFSFFLFVLAPNTIASTSTANSYILMDMKTGRVLESKNKDKQSSVASISKIMTSVIAIESGKLNNEVIVDETILKSYGSMLYLEVGEKLKLEDLLYGLLLRSGNDAADMIAKYVSGSKEKFVEKMNEKASLIGMKNTIFNNPSGLDEEDGNFSTAYDMALLTKYANKYKIYRNIVKTKKYKLKTNYKSYLWQNKNKLLNYDYITGGKTGYTKKAGRTLVTSGTYNNSNYIVVTIRDSDDWNTHKSLYKKAFANYKLYNILDSEKYNIYDKYYKNGLYIKNDVNIPLKESETKKLYLKTNLKKIKNYRNGENVGEVKVYLNDEIIYTEKVYASKINIKNKKNLWQKIKDIISD